MNRIDHVIKNSLWLVENGSKFGEWMVGTWYTQNLNWVQDLVLWKGRREDIFGI
jgi:hypothetical protein